MYVRLMANENRSVVKTLVVFTFLMVALPIGTFYAFHDFLLVGRSETQSRAGVWSLEWEGNGRYLYVRGRVLAELSRARCALLDARTDLRHGQARRDDYVHKETDLTPY